MGEVTIGRAIGSFSATNDSNHYSSPFKPLFNHPGLTTLSSHASIVITIIIIFQGIHDDLIVSEAKVDQVKFNSLSFQVLVTDLFSKVRALSSTH